VLTLRADLVTYVLTQDESCRGFSQLTAMLRKALIAQCSLVNHCRGAEHEACPVGPWVH
jgi:hypothetical protein